MEVTATASIFTKDIVGYEDDESGWYLIASPVGNVSATDVTNLANINDNDGFDLYRFNQAAESEWENWKKEGNHYHFNLEPGRGYLYANSEDVTLTFTGMPYSGSGEVTLVKDSEADLSGWNLVGNPFAETAYINKAFYRMNYGEGNAGGDEIILAENNVIAPMEGIFVYTDENGAIMTFSTEEPSKGHSSKPEPEQIVLNLSRNGGSIIDRAIVRMGRPSTGSGTGGTLPKFQIRENSTKLYIPQGGKEYAIAVIARRNDEAIQPNEMPVNFRAKENGTYTITVKPENVEMAYLHLIDNKTGADVDLLSAGDRGSEPAMRAEGVSYTFTAKTTDYESRFKLVFSANGPSTGSASDEPFAFCANGDWIISNEGKATLQAFDMLGRQLLSQEIHSELTPSNASHFRIPNSAFPVPGVYVLRLINGNDVKTQKIVVK